MFEALLMGHDDWIYSVCWQPPCLIKGIKSEYFFFLKKNALSKMLKI